jgi:hypothetical protein
MHKQIIFIGFIFVALTLPFSAQAEIYKNVDAEGRVTYSNVKTKGAKKLILEPADTSFGGDASPQRRAPAAKTATPAGFPKVDADTQKQRDGSRKDVLKSELESEKKALEEAKKAYAEGESKPEVFQKKNADGSSSTLRNVAKYQEKMKNLQDEVDAHKRNIDLLEKEINSTN